MLMLACTNPVSAQGQFIAPLGRHTVGSKLADVRSLRQSENCLIEANYADCTFTDGDGVAYVVFEDTVTTVAVTERTAGPSVRLPFGLKFGENLDVAARKLVSGGSVWTLGADPDTSAGVVLSSTVSHSGKNGWNFGVEIRFANGRLVGVSYVSGTI
ncbi:MAG: hypothetical protein KA224_06805 [Steroidobacteraceae bacterium]|nr:hypothetical protein [Steroidobacteraceae bacterium]MCC7198012.1 hypothetical protein [Gammaproteobacteria bacterium]